MYLTAVPLMLSSPDFDTFMPEWLRLCKEAGAGRIFLCTCRATDPEERRLKDLEKLRRWIPRLKQEGFEVGCWCSTLGHGGTCASYDGCDFSDGLARMESLEGDAPNDDFCPLDPAFQSAAADWLQQLARTGPNILMLDDDYRMNFRRGSRYCCCPRHTARLEQVLGEPFDPARMKRALTCGGPNRWRDAWLQVQGGALTELAGVLRRAVDAVNPAIRLTACAVLSGWDLEGVEPTVLAHCFAGSTRPLLRLSGAPYWAALHIYREIPLGTVCDYERLQLHWAAGSGIELFSEGDVHPRSRYAVPAAYLEGFDQVLQADGQSSGILKYMSDYYSSPHNETGYFERHCRGTALREKLRQCFAGKQACGVTVFEPMHTFALSHEPGPVPEERCIPASLRFTAAGSLPVCFGDGDGPTVIFGDAAEAAGPQQLAHGAILDAAAARILLRRGFSIGLEEVGEPIAPKMERFPAQEDCAPTFGGKFFRLRPAPGAQVLSTLLPEEGEAPGVCRFENAAGQRFLIYAFDARANETLAQRDILRGWCRARQIRAQLPWLGRRTPDAICDPAPGLYMLAKKDSRSLSVGLWNFCEDSILHPAVQLGADWGRLVPVAGSAVLCKRTVTLDEIPPFGCACFTLSAAEGGSF